MCVWTKKRGSMNAGLRERWGGLRHRCSVSLLNNSLSLSLSPRWVFNENTAMIDDDDIIPSKKNSVLYLACRKRQSLSADSGLESWSTGCLATSGNLYPSCTRYIIAELWDCIVIYALVHTKLSSQPP